jgi:cytochrome c
MTIRTFALPLAALIALSVEALGQETAGTSTAPEDGQLAFNNACRTCHTLREGDNRLGPNLHKIIGRKAGSLPNYGYSSAMKDADLVWDQATLDRFIANPDQVVSGNSMKPYGGLNSAEERTKIIAFLEASGRN